MFDSKNLLSNILNVLKNYQSFDDLAVLFGFDTPLFS